MQTIGFTGQCCLLKCAFLSSQYPRCSFCTREVSRPLPTDDTTTPEFTPDVHASTMLFRCMGTANRSCTEQQDFWTGWGWSAVVNKVLSSTTLLSSRKYFGSPKLSPLMSDLTTMSLKNTMNKDMLHWSVKPISCINKSPVAILMCGPVLQRCQVAKHWRKPSRAACLDLACLHAGMKS